MAGFQAFVFYLGRAMPRGLFAKRRPSQGGPGVHNFVVATLPYGVLRSRAPLSISWGGAPTARTTVTLWHVLPINAAKTCNLPYHGNPICVVTAHLPSSRLHNSAALAYRPA